MSHGHYAPLPERGAVRITGPDARDFLQRLITADMDQAAPGKLLFGALLSPQGKYLFDFFLSQTGEDAFLLDIAKERAPDFIKKLKLYRLKAKLEVEDHSDDVRVLAIWGAAPPLELALADPRLPDLGWRALVPVEQVFEVQETLAKHGFAAAIASDYDAHRIHLGAPDAARDLKIDGDFPLEGLFDEMNGVAFKKGCFIGQETASRMKRRGITRSKIAALNIDGPAIPPGTDVIAGDLRIGETRSSIPGRALAMLRLDRLAAADAPVTVAGRVAIPDVADWIILPPAKNDEVPS
jgi:folate-binding protein YgfZ